MNEWNPFCLLHKVEYLKLHWKGWKDGQIGSMGKIHKKCYVCKETSLPHKGFHGNTAPHHKSFHHASLGVFWSSAAPFASTARHSHPVGQARTLGGGKSLGEPCSWGPLCISSVFEDAEAPDPAQPKDKTGLWNMQELGKTTQLATVRFSGVGGNRQLFLLDL